MDAALSRGLAEALWSALFASYRMRRARRNETNENAAIITAYADSERDQPTDRVRFPFSPRRNPAIKRKYGEKCADRFVKKLPRQAPECARRDAKGLLERGYQPLRHAHILVPRLRFAGIFCRCNPDRTACEPARKVTPAAESMYSRIK